MLQSPEMGGAAVYLDSAYRSNAQQDSLIISRDMGHIHEKSARSFNRGPLRPKLSKKGTNERI